MFRWSAGEELVSADIPKALEMVDGLQKGRTDAKEGRKIEPVDLATIEVTLPFLTDVVTDMVRLHLLLGCRPIELCLMRPCDIDRTGDVWIYTPQRHKTEHLGKSRAIAIGPKGRDILSKYLLRSAESYCFSPQESEQKRREQLHQLRTTPMSCGNRPGTNKKAAPKKQVGDRYTTPSYRRAIHRASKKAGVEKWSPNQIRHTRGTEIRNQFGLEGAQAALGHSTAKTTQIYAQLDLERAVSIARQVG
jgi:integrase